MKATDDYNTEQVILFVLMLYVPVKIFHKHIYGPANKYLVIIAHAQKSPLNAYFI